MKARDIMTPYPFALTPSESVLRAATLMRAERVGCIPVVKDYDTRELIGMITDRDIVVRCVAEGHDGRCPLRVHMTPPPLTAIHASEDLDAVLEKMEAAQVRRAPVVNEHYGVIGIIAQADIATKVGPDHPEKLDHFLERVSARELTAV